nr:tyrosine-protein phosphatase [Nocardia bovistercoris]
MSLAFGFAHTIAAAAPPAASDTAADRALGLQGVQNARDAGGYRTVDGRSVRTGLVYRTGQLNNATPADLAVLGERGVAVVDDLRTGYERVLAPDRVPPDAVSHWYDVVGRAAPQTLATTLVPGAGMYDAFVTAPESSRAFASVLRDIIATDRGAVLYHCTAGKDRTGWTSAVLLTVLGVDRDTVRRDFLLSNTYRAADENDPLNGVSPAWLDAAFAQVDRSFGGFDAYVRSGLGLTDAEIVALKTKMLS